MNDELKALREANPVSADAYQDSSSSPEGLALLARITKTPQTRGSRRWFVLAGIGSAAAVVAVITGVGLFPVGGGGGGGAPPAFAVERTAGDTLTVTVNDFSGSWGLNADLTRYGVRGRVVEMQQPTKDCVVSEQGKVTLPPDALRPVPGARNKIMIKPGEITADTTLVFGRVTGADSPPALQVFAVRSSVDQPIACPAAGGGSTPARTTEPVVNPAAVNGNGADSNGLTPTPTR